MRHLNLIWLLGASPKTSEDYEFTGLLRSASSLVSSYSWAKDG
jgi:hypothetical protein